ncbi:hypothetical protein [Cupriavidus sp. UBA2534]|uniref:hypothetical protein n=1 Tax=Cupriavidus sp. UBA2534 TaxID=1946399 RepID=UPI000E9A3DAC|nr:hypothetical protein [Cupriavidus sp. UBA2534]HBD35945.1 hypothetical protein [Cupriavidus sp.]HBO78688.1 hypothetical protein [Cupriavidus sp.]
MIAKHTPGPWHRNIRPASKYPVVWAGRNKHVLAVKTIGLTDDEIEGNITLAAAAPDMFDALVAARVMIAEDRACVFAGHMSFETGEVEDDLGKAAVQSYDAVLQQIDAALANATGGQA